MDSEVRRWRKRTVADLPAELHETLTREGHDAERGAVDIEAEGSEARPSERQCEKAEADVPRSVIDPRRGHVRVEVAVDCGAQAADVEEAAW